MVGILAQVDDIFSWAPRGGKLIGTGWGMRIQGHGYLNILCNLGAIFVGRRPGKGSTGFCWINIIDYEQGEANAGGSAGRTRTRSAAQVAAAGGAGRPGGRGSRTRGGGATSGISGGRGAGRRGRRLCANAGAPS